MNNRKSKIVSVLTLLFLNSLTFSYISLANVISPTIIFRDNPIATPLLDQETNLYYFGYRYYNPVLGRFLTADPREVVELTDKDIPESSWEHTINDIAKLYIKEALFNVDASSFNLHNPQDLNKYSYVQNNPLNAVDPSGLIPITPWDVLDVAFFAQSAKAFWDNPGWGTAGNLALDTVSLLPVIPSLGLIRRVDDALDVIKRGDHSVDLYRQGKFSTNEFKGSHVKGKQWATDNPLRTSNYSKKYGLPLENTGKPDWVIKGKYEKSYKSRFAPESYNNPANKGGGTEILPDESDNVILEWFHMP